MDLEGVLVPEIWIAVAEKAGIPELRRTTRDEPDYDKLMKGRLAILDKHGLRLSDIQSVIATLRPLPGAREFLDALRLQVQFVILSDTFEQFAQPLRSRLFAPHRREARDPIVIRQLFQTITATMDSDLAFTSERVEISGDLAYDSGTYKETLITRATGKAQHTSGDYLTVYRRTKAPNGNAVWLIVEQVWTGAPPE